ncbi:hypothetical protein [Actinomyces radicidentis]|uniref:hypothetical protein n=1 Tax=Actinomyces radicidentis TaxID=111015 RepID=UPI00147053EF|nr:hypothetical protein [Actinomyces radicidentis]
MRAISASQASRTGSAASTSVGAAVELMRWEWPSLGSWTQVMSVILPSEIVASTCMAP